MAHGQLILERERAGRLVGLGIRFFLSAALTAGQTAGGTAPFALGWVTAAGPGLEGAAANTMAFATLTLCQLFHAFNVRSEDRSLFAQGVLSNPAMNRAFLAGLAMQLSVLLIPPLQGVFSVTPMDAPQWFTVLALAAAPIPICEWAKARRRRQGARHGAREAAVK